MERKRFSIKERFKSFGFAIEGLGAFFITQHNAWIHLFAAAAAVFLGFYFDLSSDKWCWIIAAIAIVFIAEMFNTALEFLSDIVSPNLHPQIKKVKDVSAAAVLIAAIAALMIGLMVFLPEVMKMNEG
jgi:diacylglycerol kinase (ATP)